MRAPKRVQSLRRSVVQHLATIWAPAMLFSVAVEPREYAHAMIHMLARDHLDDILGQSFHADATFRVGRRVDGQHAGHEEFGLGAESRHRCGLVRVRVGHAVWACVCEVGVERW